MKKKILLLENSLTVQKVVSLSVDRSRFHILYASTNQEALQMISEDPPHLILVSDQVENMDVGSFPREVESRLSRMRRSCPPMILIASEDVSYRSYTGILKKPFTPEEMRRLISKCFANESAEAEPFAQKENELSRNPKALESVFNRSFSDEQDLVNETLQMEHRSPNSRSQTETSLNDPRTLWSDPNTDRNQRHMPPKGNEVLRAKKLWSEGPNQDEPLESTPHTHRSPLAVSPYAEPVHLSPQMIEAIVDKAVAKILPATVERLVKERLDELLKAQE